jgi:hypothetical protein
MFFHRKKQLTVTLPEFVFCISQSVDASLGSSNVCKWIQTRSARYCRRGTGKSADLGSVMKCAVVDKVSGPGVCLIIIKGVSK